MARRLGETPFAELLPHNLAQDATLKAVADSLDKILAPSIAGIAPLLIYDRLSKAAPQSLLPPLMRLAEQSGGLAPLPEQLLDMLAWQLHVDGYEAAYDYQAKERLIWQSLMLHRRKGTPWAVRNALAAAFGGEASIDEWFNYAGKPYFFRAWLDVTGLFWDQEATPKALRLIWEYKNVRSWLEFLETRSRTPMEHHTGIGLVERIASRCRLYFSPVPAPDMRMGTALCATGATAARSIFYMPPPAAMPLQWHTGVGLSCFTSSRLTFRSEPANAPEFVKTATLALSVRTSSGYAVQ